MRECDADFPGGGWEDCDCEEDPEEEWICVLTDVEAGLTCPFPNLCFAECAGYSAEDVVEDGCDDFGWGNAWGDCDCEEDENGEGLCVEVEYEGDMFEVWVPSECHAECWYTDYTLIECDDWDGGWTDCDCEEDEEGICIEVNYDGDVYVEWVPSECFAECWGITDYTVVECDDWDNGGDWDDCDCEEDEEGICIEVNYEGDVFEMWVPSECHAECWEIGEYTVVECDDWDGGWTDCDCEEDEEGICIEVNYDGDVYVEWIPSECHAECWGITDYTVVECDDWDDWNWEDCDCEENEEGICIEVDYEGEVFQMWVPSECHADCWEVGEYTVVECDDWDGGFPGGDWDECDCEISDEDETVCVLTNVETGEVCPFPNMCFAECFGYTAEDVVECDDTWVWNDDTEFPEGGFDCEDCFEDEGETVCVELEGQVFELPNACFAECLGLDIVDCSDLDNDTPPVIDMDRQTSENIQIFFAGGKNVAYTVEDDTNNTVSKELNVFPNPVQDVLNVNLEMLQDVEATINVIDYTGRIISSNVISLTKGFNTTNINTTNYTGGIYHLQVLTNDEVITSKFVKL